MSSNSAPVDMVASPIDHVSAAELAELAGTLLLRLRSAEKCEPRELGRRGDAASNELLVRELGQRFPRDAILSEEAVDDVSRLNAARVWIIDPLDGTREFGERGREDWAVHVALVMAGRVAAAAVALPARDIVLSTLGRGAAPAQHAAGARRILVSRTRPPKFAGQLADDLGAELVPMGSAGAKTAAVVLGEADAYVHAGGQYEWDSAAPIGVALAWGFHASRLDGGPLIYNRLDPLLPDLLVCRADLAPALLEGIARLG